MFHDDAFLEDILLPTHDSLEEFALFDDALPFWQDGIVEPHHEISTEWPDAIAA